MRVNTGQPGTARRYDNWMRSQIRQVEAELRRIVTDNARQLRDELEEATPKDTGKAAAAWRVEVKNGPVTGAAVDAGGIAPAGTEEHLPTVTVANDVPYIADLEQGKSPQARAGFFAAACRNCEARIEQAVKRLQNKRFG